VHWLDAGSDELLACLRVLNSYDIDLAADQTRLTSRLRDALTKHLPRRWNGRSATGCTRPECVTCWRDTRR
jgi:hypothetical protein